MMCLTSLPTFFFLRQNGTIFFLLLLVASLLRPRRAFDPSDKYASINKHYQILNHLGRNSNLVTSNNLRSMYTLFVLSYSLPSPTYPPVCRACTCFSRNDPILPPACGSPPPSGAAATSPQKEPQLNLNSTTHNHITSTNP